MNKTWPGGRRNAKYERIQRWIVVAERKQRIRVRGTSRIREFMKKLGLVINVEN